ncbi:MAG: hypothetical protein IKQ80_13275 [Clostridia bacterium]|nr:hypothetical protein [Clostridia bacterium]
MKYTVKKALALLIAMLMALPTFALAEAPLEGIPGAEDVMIVAGEDGDIFAPPADEIVSEAVDESYEEAGELALGGDDAGLEPEPHAPLPREALQDAVATWWFIVDDTLIATQEAREGDAIARPEDPVCPEGTVFDGWFLEDGTPLFIDADGDGGIDPVIAHPDPLCPEVNVIGRYVGDVRGDGCVRGRYPGGRPRGRGPGGHGSHRVRIGGRRDLFSLG